jgi:uncharacterized protein (DUF58 family)
MTSLADRDPRRLANLPGLEWKARYVMEGFLPGLHGSPFHGASVEFRDYREYQPGDDPRRLDWRLYARNDRLYVRRYEQETNARAYLLCDTSASMGYRGGAAWATKLQAAQVLALSIGWMLIQQSDAVGAISLEASGTSRNAKANEKLRYIRPSQKSHQAGLLLRELESLRVGGGPALARLLEHAARIALRRAFMVLFSDLLDPSDEVLQGLRRLRFEGHECVCFQVLDGDEIDFPFTESAVFEDMETGARRQVSGHAARAAYRARFTAFQAEWRERLRDLDVRHVVVRTDEDPGAVLRRFFA